MPQFSPKLCAHVGPSAQLRPAQAPERRRRVPRACHREGQVPGGREVERVEPQGRRVHRGTGTAGVARCQGSASGDRHPEEKKENLNAMQCEID